jgi:hypothetical protein
VLGNATEIIITLRVKHVKNRVIGGFLVNKISGMSIAFTSSDITLPIICKRIFPFIKLLLGDCRDLFLGGEQQ